MNVPNRKVDHSQSGLLYRKITMEQRNFYAFINIEDVFDETTLVVVF